MLDARTIALDALTHITTDRIEVDDALSRTGFANLNVRDRGFAFTLVMTCLRWGRAADHLLMAHMETLLPERKQRAKWAMRMGVIQLRVMGTPDHAAVSETVDLMKADKADKAFAGLTNAVLKKIATERPVVEPVHAFPHWLETRWRAAYSDDDFRAMAHVMVEQPPLDITVPKQIYEYEKTLGAHKFGTCTLRMPKEISGGEVAALAGYKEGAWWVQDAAATIPVQLLGDIAGREVLDMCAAPGGKTAQLCAAGALVSAIDRSPSRIKRLRENMDRLKMTPTIIDADVLKWAPKKQFDAILLDAPCSATGTIRRHPEIGWIRSARDDGRMEKVQREMLEQAWEWLKVGGKLVYAVCSLEPSEGEQQMEWFAQTHANAAITRPAMQEGAVPQEAWTLQNTVRVLPHYNAASGGYDGFFCACIVKRAA